MKINPGSRKRVTAHMRVDFNPTGTAVAVWLGGAWRTAEWVGSPVKVKDEWLQDALTVDYFTGDPGMSGAILLPTGVEILTKTRVTMGSDVTVSPSTPVTVTD